MLHPVPVKRITIVFHKTKQDKLVSALHEAGIVQLREATSVEAVKRKIQQEVSQLAELLSKLSEMEELLGVYKGRPRPVTEQSLEQILQEAQRVIKRIEPKMRKYRESREKISEELQNLKEQLSVLKPFEELRLPLRYLRPSQHLHVVVGFLDEDLLEGFASAVSKTFDGRAVVFPIARTKRTPIVVVCRAEHKQKLLPLLYRFGVELVELPEVKGTPATAIQKLQARIERLEKELKGINAVFQKLGRQHSREVSCARELLEIQKERMEAIGLFGFRESVVVLEAWALEGDLARVKNLLHKVTGGRFLLLTADPAPSELDQVPIELRNPKVVKDFEFLTGMYGLPKYNEIDPTWFLAVSFPIFFGLCLSDAGYGLALAAFMLSGIWFAKSFPPYLRRMMALCGVVTAVVSLFVGGWFGFGSGLWVNPVENPIPLLKLVIFIGILHLVIAFGVAGVLKDLRQRAWQRVLFERLSRVLIILGFFGLSFCILGAGLYEFGIAYTFPRMGLFEVFNPAATAPAVVQALRVLFFGGVLLGVIGAVTGEKGLRSKFGGSINVIYGITGFIADVTSYTRLLALGVATGVIAYSINFIISIFWGWFVSPYLSFSPMAVVGILSAAALGLVFVAGHSFNIFINTLGGFIHTMRLHFAEFFGKFYEGGGEKFQPFKAKRRFTILRGGVSVGK